MTQTRHWRNRFTCITWLNFHNHEMLFLLDKREKQMETPKRLAWKDSFIYSSISFSFFNSIIVIVVLTSQLVGS